MSGGYVYILANRKNGALYAGVTADIANRMIQHKAGEGSKFCRKYGIDKLVYIEATERIEDAIAREKAIKKVAASMEGGTDRKEQSRLARPVLRSQSLTLGPASEMGPRFRGDDGGSKASACQS